MELASHIIIFKKIQQTLHEKIRGSSCKPLKLLQGCVQFVDFGWFEAAFGVFAPINQHLVNVRLPWLWIKLADNPKHAGDDATLLWPLCFPETTSSFADGALWNMVGEDGTKPNQQKHDVTSLQWIVKRSMYIQNHTENPPGVWKPRHLLEADHSTNCWYDLAP